MSKDKISDYSATANSNTDIGGINIDEGCAPSGINDAIRTLMKQLKDWQSGSQDVYIHPAGSASVPSITATGDTNTGMFFPAADTVGIATGGTERARVDSSGNLGLGVTPSAWSQGKAFEIKSAGTGIFNNTVDETYYSNNAYYNAGWKYGATNYAEQYIQYAGQHIWKTAPSGTAGNAISFTQAMTLSAAGGLSVGTTTDAGSGNTLITGNYQTTGASFVYSSAGGAAGAVRSGIQLDGTNNVLALYTAQNERARIDSNGVLMLGTNSVGSSPTAYLQVGGNSTTSRILPRTDNTGYVGDSGQRWQALYAVNGTIQTSDGREKNTIQDSNLGLSFINSLRPVSYKWNVGENVVTYDEEGNEVVTPRAGARTHYGFIAQEVQAAIPSGVDFGGFVQEPDDGPMSLRYHEFIGPLVKAIQEQQAIITQLQADVAALKGQA